MANPLYSVPGLGGYLASQDMRQDQEARQIQQVMGLAGLLEKRKDREIERQLLSMKLQKAMRDQSFQESILDMVRQQQGGGGAPAGPTATGRGPNPVALGLALSGLSGGPAAAKIYADAVDPGDVEWKDLGNQLVPVYKKNGQPVPGLQPQPKGISPGDEASVAERRRQHGTPSAYEQSRMSNDAARVYHETGQMPGQIPAQPGTPGQIPMTPQGQPDWQNIEARRIQAMGGYVPPSDARPSAPTSQPGLPPKAADEVTAANAKEMFKINAKQYQEFRQKLPELNSSVKALDRISTLIDRGETFSNSGAEFKMWLSSLGQALGVPINVKQLADSEEYVAQVAELLKARLGSKDYGSGTGVSNLDLIAAGKPLPELVKSKEGQKQIIQALISDAKERLADIQAYMKHFDANRGDMSSFVLPSSALTEERIKRIQAMDKKSRPANVWEGKVRQGGQIKFLGFE